MLSLVLNERLPNALVSALALVADLDPDEWEFPPKPKWMRWRTYDRYERKFDAYEAILDEGCAELLAKFLVLNPH